MNKRIRARLLITVCVTSFACYLLMGFPPSLANMEARIQLGLDLKGGTHLILGVVTDDAVRAETDRAIERLRQVLERDNVRFRQDARLEVNHFRIAGVDSSRRSDFRRILNEEFPEWNVVSTTGSPPDTYLVRMEAAAENGFRDQAVVQAMLTIRNRVDGLGVTEPVIQRYGGAGRYEILVQLPGVDDSDRVRRVVQSTSFLELKLADSGPFPSEQAARVNYGGTLPADLELMESAERDATGSSEEWYAVRRVAAITGRDLRSAYTSRDENNRPAVGFTLTPDGSRRFGRVTEENIGRTLAIVLDERIQSAARIEERISYSGIIRGGSSGFTLQEAQDLALVLRSGALPASLEYLAESQVSASLGADSIRQGVLAGVVALVAVVLFMLFYYRMSGVNATVAMILNILILFSALAYFGAALTLPGIAGVILTIGVGIDSNILIFERIREELRSGKTPVSSVATGFSRVFITLVDTHMAALISAMFLFLFGTGAVRGFAVTLVIGLVTNLFTSVFVSRTLFEWLLSRRRRADSLSI